MENLKTSMGTALLPILASLASAITPLIEQMGPSLIQVATSVGTIIANNVIPALIPIVQQLIPPLLSMLPTLVSLFNVFAGSLMSALAPILNTVVGILVQLIGQLTPLLEMLMPPLIELLGSILGLVNALLPIFMMILSEAIIPLIELLLPPLINLLEKVVTVATDLANWLSNHLKPAFDSISNAISGVVNWVNSLISKLTSIKLPDWLTPGSPTPFELGLRGIASALKEVNADIGGLTVNAPNQPAYQSTTLVVNVSSMMSLADMADAEMKLKPIIRNAMRGVA